MGDTNLMGRISDAQSEFTILVSGDRLSDHRTLFCHFTHFSVLDDDVILHVFFRPHPSRNHVASPQFLRIRFVVFGHDLNDTISALLSPDGVGCRIFQNGDGRHVGRIDIGDLGILVSIPASKSGKCDRFLLPHIKGDEVPLLVEIDRNAVNDQQDVGHFLMDGVSS